MGSRAYKNVYSFSEGIDFKRQNLTSEIDPRAIRVNADLTSTTLAQHKISLVC